jgi:hypothetical protein
MKRVPFEGGYNARQWKNDEAKRLLAQAAAGGDTQTQLRWIIST